MKKSFTLFYLVDNRDLLPSQIVNVDTFNEEFDLILNRLFENIELTVPHELVQKTLNCIKGS